MRVPDIKNIKVRRVVMIAVTPFFAFQYMYLGLRSMVQEFKFLWNYEHSTIVHEGVWSEDLYNGQAHEGYASVDTENIGL